LRPESTYLYSAAPHIAWLAASTGLRFSTAAFHAGFVGASIALLALHAQFRCCVDNGNGLGWLLYWPLAALLMTVGVEMELTARRLREDSRP
jgi:hypothetical protein